MSRAGFERKSADDPSVRVHSDALPVQKLVKATRDDGSSRYVFNDPKGCRCIYVGDDDAYETYKNLQRQQQTYNRIQAEHEAEEGSAEQDRMEWEAQEGLWFSGS